MVENTTQKLTEFFFAWVFTCLEKNYEKKKTTSYKQISTAISIVTSWFPKYDISIYELKIWPKLNPDFDYGLS